MAIYGALGEGWAYANGSRNGEFLFRGLATFASAATVVVTVPLPIRLVTHAMVSMKSTTAPAGDIMFTTGNYTGNAFTIYGWQSTAYGTLPAAAQITVGTSVFSYTSGTSGPAAPNGEMITLQPTSTDAVTWTITRGAVTTGTMTGTSLGPFSTFLEPGDVMAVTWATGAPVMYSFPAPGPSGALTAYSSSVTVEWIAFCNLLGTTPIQNQP